MTEMEIVSLDEMREATLALEEGIPAKAVRAIQGLDDHECQVLWLKNLAHQNGETDE